jgi:hypothetical protein
MNIKRPQTTEPPGRIPASGRDGRDWGLEIADWEFACGADGKCGQNAKQTQFASFGYIEVGAARYEIRDTRYASVVWTLRQTNPIGAGETPAIADRGFGIGDCGEPETGDLSALRQTNPITLYIVVPILPGHYISRTRRGEWKTKPISAAGGRDWGLGIADWGFAAGWRGTSVGRMSNKANPGRGGLGIDYG